MLARKGLALDAVVELTVDPKILIQRILTRAAQSAEGPREDDTEEALTHRLTVYDQQTAPVSAHYKKQGLLRAVDGMLDIDAVTQEIKQSLGI